MAGPVMSVCLNKCGTAKGRGYDGYDLSYDSAHRIPSGTSRGDAFSER